MKRMRFLYLLMALLATAGSAASEGMLGANQRIFSEHLGYDLQYRVYRPAGTSADDQLPTLYVTDGQRYLEKGGFKPVLDEAIDAGVVAPVLVVFLDSRNPDRLEVDRRNAQFMCNADFAAFFADELVPTISRDEPVSLSREDRAILGISFGGLNSACFGLMLSNIFSGIGMQSPASSDHVDVVSESYEERDLLPLKIFLSAGTQNDNLASVKRFKRVLDRKGYDVTYFVVREGHNWRNWTPLLDDVLKTFFPEKK